MTTPTKFGTIKFNLDTSEGEESMINAINADFMKMQIDEVYQSIFRPYFKYDASIFNIKDDRSKVEIELEDFYGNKTKLEVDANVVSTIENKVMESLWEKLQSHFKKNE